MKKKIFVSHAGVDSDWASWIGHELVDAEDEASEYLVVERLGDGPAAEAARSGKTLAAHQRHVEERRSHEASWKSSSFPPIPA